MDKAPCVTQLHGFIRPGIVRSQRRARRLRRTVAWSALGALIGLVAVFAFALFKRR